MRLAVIVFEVVSGPLDTSILVREMSAIVLNTVLHSLNKPLFFSFFFFLQALQIYHSQVHSQVGNCLGQWSMGPE